MGELSVDFNDVYDVTINGSLASELHVNGKVAWRNFKRARSLALNLTDTTTRGWSKSSWFFKPAPANESAQTHISHDYFFTTPTNEWCYTRALGGQWLYITPASVLGSPFQVKFLHPSIGWQFCTADTIARYGRTYNYAASDSVGPVGWLEWRNPSVPTKWTANVYNHTSKRWYFPNLTSTTPKPESNPTD